MPDRPNVLVIMTDQERYPPPYEREALARFRREQLPARERLRERSAECHRHYVAATACLPSRASLFTGQYPSRHGVLNTDGLTKAHTDPAMTWLDPTGVPTIGDWFRALGYRTHYRGKWHISRADLVVAGTHHPLMTNDRDGTVHPDIVDAYRRADRLDPFGFSGWIGREPHGAHPADTGFVRDPLFAAQVTDLLADLAAGPRDQPWLAVASFVNPHDIAFSGFGWEVLEFPPVAEVLADIPEVPEPPSQRDPLSARPSCQAEFRDRWHRMLYEQPADATYRRFYHWLHVLVDAEIARVLDALEAHGFAEDTIVVFTSDHGDVLGAHGGLQQKWYNAYDEALRVPMLVAGPGIDPTVEVAVPTSHVDVLPTLLGLLDADVEAAAAAVARTHVEVHEPVGRDLSGVLSGAHSRPPGDDAVYFMGEDHLSDGLRNRNRFTGEVYEPVGAPWRVESVVVPLRAADGGGEELWKLNHYYDGRPGRDDDEGVPSQWELHNLTADPEERVDLLAAAAPSPSPSTDAPAGAPSGAASGPGGDAPPPVAELRDRLAVARAAKRLPPTHRGPLW